jgi:hypothetical protein
MALWGGIFTKLQSATCKALWGITEFSEDALSAVDLALKQGVAQGVAVSTVINNTFSGNVGKGAIIYAVLNETLPVKHGSQVGNGTLINMFLNKTVLPKSEIAVGNGTSINGILNKVMFQKPGNVIADEDAWLNATAPHSVEGMEPKVNSSADIQENFVVPATESSIYTSTTSTTRAQNPLGLLPVMINKPLINRTALFPRPGLFPRPAVG